MILMTRSGDCGFWDRQIFAQGNKDRGLAEIAALDELPKIAAEAAKPGEARHPHPLRMPLLRRAAEQKPAADPVAEQKAKEVAQKAQEAATKERERKEKLAAEAASELRALLAIAENRPEEARELLAKAGDIPKPRLARLYALAGDAAKAETLAREAVTAGIDEVQPLATLVEVLAANGKMEDAKTEFGKLQALSARAELNLPIFERLKPTAQTLGLPADWLPAPVAAGDWAIAHRLTRWAPWPGIPGRRQAGV